MTTGRIGLRANLSHEPTFCADVCPVECFSIRRVIRLPGAPVGGADNDPTALRVVGG